jgi:hypothetical protein
MGGINIVTGLSGGSCCNTFNGKPFINVGKMKDNSFGNLSEIPNFYAAWSMNNVVLFLHETRHLDGYSHTNCCLYGTVNGQYVCDSKYDLSSLSPHGMHMWWFESVLQRKFDFGFDCMPESFIKTLIDNTWITMNNHRNSFCIVPAVIAKPAYWTDCRYK